MTLVRAIITFTNPTPKQLIVLTNAIFNSPSDHQLYVANSLNQLVIYSTEIPRSVKVLSNLSEKPITPELIEKIRDDIDIPKFK